MLAGSQEAFQEIERSMETASQTRTVAASLRALLEGLVDYAGLFPPAALGMQQAVANYASYLAGDHHWMLGRFIVPAARLAEFRSALKYLEIPQPWRVSAIIGPDAAGEFEFIAAFNREMRSKAVINAIEVKASNAEEVRSVGKFVPESVMPYFEVPASAPVELLSAIAAVNARAKIRTGGVVESAFPAAAMIVQFLLNCAEAKVAFKATAGLHHPLRCVKPLTYEKNAPSGAMHGFLNVFLAASVVHALTENARHEQRGQLRKALPAILLNDQPANFVFRDDKATIRGTLAESGSAANRNPHFEFDVATPVIRRVRETFAIAFGSCSFDEPIEDLRTLNLL
jgi:hypothetical protein